MRSMINARFSESVDYTISSNEYGGRTVINLNSLIDVASRELRAPVETRTAPPPPTDRWVTDYLGQDVSRFFYKWGGSFSAVLVRLRGRYDGDLDQFLIHLVFMLTDLASANAMAEARTRGAVTVIRRRRGLNVLSLADITRIPRESVRRKLAAMVDRSLVVREPDGLYYPGPASDIDGFFYTLSPLFWDGVRPG